MLSVLFSNCFLYRTKKGAKQTRTLVVVLEEKIRFHGVINLKWQFVRKKMLPSSTHKKPDTWLSSSTRLNWWYFLGQFFEFFLFGFAPRHSERLILLQKIFFRVHGFLTICLDKTSLVVFVFYGRIFWKIYLFQDPNIEYWIMKSDTMKWLKFSTQGAFLILIG